MADEKCTTDDWSSRHVRLRFELMAASLLLAAFAFVENPINTSVILPVNLEQVDPAWLFTIVACFYGYTFVHFWTRTALERARIAGAFDHITELTTAIQSVTDNAKQSYDVKNADAIKKLSSEHIAVIANFVHHLNDTLTAIERHSGFLVEQLSSVKTLDQSSEEMHVSRMSDLVERQKFQYSQWTEKANEQMQFYDDLQAYFKTGLHRSIEDANAKVLADFAGVEAMKREFLSYRNHMGFERMLMSCYIPASISLFITAASIGRFLATA